jgi:hypothetical protein
MEAIKTVVELLFKLGPTIAKFFLEVWKVVTGDDEEARKKLLEIVEEPTRRAVQDILDDPDLAEARKAVGETIDSVFG